MKKKKNGTIWTEPQMKRYPKGHQDIIVYYSEEHLTSKLKHINIDTHLTIKRKSFGKKQDAAIVL